MPSGGLKSRPCRLCDQESIKVHRYCPEHWAIRHREAGLRLGRKPTSVEQRRAYRLKEIYKLTPGQFDEMLAAQGGKCAVCGTTKPGGMGRFHIDHDHACCPYNKNYGKVCGKCTRGLVCFSCNQMIGYAKDNTDILMAGVTYLMSRVNVLAEAS